MVADTSDSSTLAPAGRSDFALWRACAWGGPVYIVGVLVSWAGFAGFIPPPAQDWGSARVATFYADNEVSIRIGMEGVLIFAMFYFVWSLALRRVMQQHESRGGFLSTIQFVGGVSTAWITMGCAVLWLTASFRASTPSAQGVVLLNDLGWMAFDTTAMATMFQMVAFGAWILGDNRSEPAMPRWLAYLTFWLAASFLAVYLMPSFQTGAFSWQGLITLSIALGAFFVWTVITSWYLLKAIMLIENGIVVSAR